VSEKRRLIGIENWVLRRILGPSQDKIIGEWRKLHKEELHSLYFSPNIIRIIKSRRMTWVGNVSVYVGRRGVYRILEGVPEGKRQLGRSSSKWEDSIRNGRIILEMGWEDKTAGI